MADPWAWWSADTIGQIAKCPSANVAENWPLIVDALDAHGIYERDVARGVLGTIAIETASTFQPVREAYWLPESWRQANLRYYPFYGRGFDQTTWEDGYRQAGEFLGRDLLAQPDLLLRADLSARVLAWRFATKGVPSKDGTRYWTFAQLCCDHDWTWLRRGIQGGEAGLDRLLQIVNDLGDGTMPTVTYNANEPAIAQNDTWSCAPTSLRWAMKAVGRSPQEGWMEPTMIAEGVVSEDKGLLDATGAGLAAFVRRHYAEFGYDANHEPSVSFDAVANEGTGPGVNGKAYPILLGGRGWNHWSGVRGYDPARDVLLLANPAPGYPNGTGPQQEMTRAQFAQLGPFSMVRVFHPDLLAVFDAPEPEPVPFDKAAAAARVRALLALHDQYDQQIRAELTTLLAMLDAA